MTLFWELRRAAVNGRIQVPPACYLGSKLIASVSMLEFPYEPLVGDHQ